MEKSEYKNAVRSRKLIRTAYAELLQEKEAEKITVTDIAKRANISRGTFYAHYSDSMAVLRQIEDEFFQYMLTILDEFQYTDIIKDPYPILWRTFQILEQKKDFFSILVNRKDINTFAEKLMQFFITNIISSENIPEEVKTDEQFQCAIHFYAGGIVMLYQSWLKNSFSLSLKDLVSLISTLLKTGWEPFSSSSIPKRPKSLK